MSPSSPHLHRVLTLAKMNNKVIDNREASWYSTTNLIYPRDVKREKRDFYHFQTTNWKENCKRYELLLLTIDINT